MLRIHQAALDLGYSCHIYANKNNKCEYVYASVCMYLICKYIYKYMTNIHVHKTQV